MCSLQALAQPFPLLLSGKTYLFFLSSKRPLGTVNRFSLDQEPLEIDALEVELAYREEKCSFYASESCARTPPISAILLSLCHLFLKELCCDLCM